MILGLSYNIFLSFRLARNFSAPHGGRVTTKVAEKNHGLRTAWFGAWYPK